MIFFDRLWSMKSRDRRVKRAVIEVIIALLEIYDHRNVCTPLTFSSFIFFIDRWIYIQ